MIWLYELMTLPLVVWIVRGYFGYFEDIPLEAEEAAKVDGCNWWGTFRHVALPLAAPGTAAALPPASIYAWNRLHLRAHPGRRAHPNGHPGALNFLSSEQQVHGQMAAAVLISILPVLASALYGQKYLVRGLSLGAVKE